MVVAGRQVVGDRQVAEGMEQQPVGEWGGVLAAGQTNRPMGKWGGATNHQHTCQVGVRAAGGGRHQ